MKNDFHVAILFSTFQQPVRIRGAVISFERLVYNLDIVRL